MFQTGVSDRLSVMQINTSSEHWRQGFHDETATIFSCLSQTMRILLKVNSWTVC